MGDIIISNTQDNTDRAVAADWQDGCRLPGFEIEPGSALIIVTNLYVLAEELSVIKNTGAGHVMAVFDEDYVSYETGCRMDDIIGQLFGIRCKTLNTVKEHGYEYVISPSRITPYIKSVLSSVSYSRLILAENGAYDYLERDPGYRDILSRSELWLSCPESAAAAGYYKSVCQLWVDSTVLDRIKEHYSLWKYTDVDPVFFTSAVEEDFNMQYYAERTMKYIEKNYSGCTVYLKKHPRDTAEYRSDVVGLREIPQELPGQIVSGYFTGTKIYGNFSTVYMMDPDKSRSYILFDGKCSNRKYKRSCMAVDSSHLVDISLI